MISKDLQERNLINEAWFQTSRASGKGGQNVNKVETRVELFFNITESKILTEKEKATLSIKLKNKISSEGILKLYTDQDRSQFKNKAIITKRFYELLVKALFVNKKRVATKPSKSSVEKRLNTKQKVKEAKAGRKKIVF